MLAASFIEFFGRDFAQDLSLVTIESAPARVLVNTTYEEAKRFVIGERYGEKNNDFSLAFSELEQAGFFDKSNFQYVFVITDGIPEVHEQGYLGGAWSGEDWKLTKTDTERIIYYLRERWTRNPQVEYFWVQVDPPNTLLEFCVNQMYYIPPKEEALETYKEDFYNSICAGKRSGSLDDAFPMWGKFLWEASRNGDMFYTSIADCLSGIGFHKMMDYFLHKFQRRLKM
jgi:hypothetical protein